MNTLSVSVNLNESHTEANTRHGPQITGFQCHEQSLG